MGTIAARLDASASRCYASANRRATLRRGAGSAA